MEEIINSGLSEFEADMYFKCLGIEREWEDKVEQETIFAIMGEQVRIAGQLIGLLEDSVIAEITGVSINDINSMKS